MTDSDIRALLRCDLRAKYQDPDTIIVEELALRHGKTRVDIAVVNGLLHGFELKSDCDTLKRLANQAGIYSSVLDRATLVVGQHHLPEAIKLVPSWWGVSLAETSDNGELRIVEVRLAGDNPAPDALEIAKLLWRSEALVILHEYGATNGVLSKPRRVIYARLAEAVGLDVLRDRVRCQLKSRRAWRPVRRHTSNDD